MTEDLFTPTGPEGRNLDAEVFTQGLDAMAGSLGYRVLAPRADILPSRSRRGRGVDGIWSVYNPQSQKSEGWLPEGKRHDGPGRYTPEQMRDEVQTLRDKIALLDRNALYEDAELAPYLDELRGGILCHHTQGWDDHKVRRARREASAMLRRHERGPRPVAVLMWGPDILNSIAETFSRFGMPLTFWWPPTHLHNATWARACPPAQLAAGLVLYRTADGRQVLWVRDSLSRQDPPAYAKLALRAGETLDVVASGRLNSSAARVLADSWRRAGEEAKAQGHPALPSRVAPLSVDVGGMRAFERSWHPEHGGLTPAAPLPLAGAFEGPHPRALQPPTGRRSRRRRRAEVDYPSPLAVAATMESRGTLHGCRQLLAEEGLFVFAAELGGLAQLVGDTWLMPPTYRRLGQHLETSPHPSIMGFGMTRMPTRDQQLPTLERMSMFDDFRQHAEALRGRQVDQQHEVTLRCVEKGDERWPWRGTLAYRRVVDIEGGERIAAEACVPLLARPSGEGALDLACITVRSNDLQAATAWLHSGLRPSQRGWLVSQQALPREEIQRVEALKSVLEQLGGPRLAVASPNQHRDVGHNAPEAGFARALRVARYETDMLSLEEVFARARADAVLVGELTSYIWWREGGERNVILAIRARQRPTDAHLSLGWQGGKRNDSQAMVDLAWDRWSGLESLGWSDEEKRTVLASLWARTLEAMRAQGQHRHAADRGA